MLYLRSLYLLFFFPFIFAFAQSTYVKKYPDVKMKTVTNYVDINKEGAIFHTFKDFLVVEMNSLNPLLRDLLKSKGPRWVTFETNSLQLNFKEGDEIQYVDRITGELKIFTFPKHVYLALRKNDSYGEGNFEENKNYYKSLNILLKDSNEGVVHPDDQKKYPRGFGYLGNKYKLKKPFLKGDFVNVSEDDEGLKKILDSYFEKEGKGIHSSFKLTRASKGVWGKYSFYKIEGRDTSKEHDRDQMMYGSVLLVDGKEIYNFNGSWEYPDYSPMGEHISYGNFIEGADLTFLISEGSMHTCYQIGIFKNGKLTFERMSCDSGGC